MHVVHEDKIFNYTNAMIGEIAVANRSHTSYKNIRGLLATYKVVNVEERRHAQRLSLLVESKHAEDWRHYVQRPGY